MNNPYEEVMRVMEQLAAGPTDEDEGWDNDYKIIRANAHLFSREIIEGLLYGLLESRQTDPLTGNLAQFDLVGCERGLEIIQRICDVTGHADLEAPAAFEQGKLCEELGRFVSAVDCYDIARQATLKIGDRKNYLAATFNKARVCMQASLDYLGIPLLNEAMGLAEEFGNEEILTRSCNYLIYFYEKKGDQTEAERVRKILKNHR